MFLPQFYEEWLLFYSTFFNRIKGLGCRGKYKTWAPQASMNFVTFELLCADKLSIITTSPGLRKGQSCFSIYCSKIALVVPPHKLCIVFHRYFLRKKALLLSSTCHQENVHNIFDLLLNVHIDESYSFLPTTRQDRLICLLEESLV